MTLSSSTLDTIQQAGQALHQAHQAVNQSVQESAQQMVATVASNPFSPESDRAYAQLRALARMAQELLAMEEQMKTLYLSAQEQTQPETPVLVALPAKTASPRLQRNPATEKAADTEDVLIKPEPAVKKAVKAKTKPAPAPAVAPAKPAKSAKPVVVKAAQPAAAVVSPAPENKAAPLSGNDLKLQKYLKTVLNKRSGTALTHSAIALGTGIPTGSVGLALRRAMQAGFVSEAGKGTYRLN